MNTKLIALCAAVLATSTAAAAVTTSEPRSIPSIEAERRVAPRGDTGRLTREALAQQEAAVSTSSSIYTVDGVTSPRIDLPITGGSARIAVASDTDRDLDVRLDGPAGVELSTTAFGRTLAPAANAEDVSNKVVRRRGDAGRGALVVSDERALEPGTYSLTVRRSKSPVNVYVHDAGGPELVLRLSETTSDDRQPVTLYAELRDDVGLLPGAEVTARIGADVRLRLAETELGSYSVTIVPSELGLTGTVRFAVNAKGTTRHGLRLQRDGGIDLITGRARAEIVEIGREELTETDVVVPVRIRVAEPGRYHARANLLGLDGEPIAWAQDARNLPAGEHVLMLRFDRSILGGGSGLRLSDLRVMDVTAMPGITLPGAADEPRLVRVSE